MKNRKLWFSGLILLPVAVIIFVGSFSTTPDPRSEYEKRLLQSAKSIPEEKESGKDAEEEAGMDRPDIAAYTDYIKTMDPKTGAIPQGRLTMAYDETRSMQSLKSGSSKLTWTNRINNIGGRTRTIFNDPTDPQHKKVWAGSVTGGLWYNDDAYGNAEWYPVDDFWPGLAVACMASDPLNTNTWYVGTGESQTALMIYRESSTRGVGIMRSTDAGKTWNLMASTKDWAYVTDIVVRNENGQSVIYAGVVSGIYRGKLHESGPTDGLYRSVNGGESWSQVLPMIAGGSRPFAPSDIEVSADGSRIFVGTTYHGEDRLGAASILYSDNGTNWTVMDDYYDKLTSGQVWERNGFPYSYPGRVMLANAPSNPNVMYAIIAGGLIGDNNFVIYTDRYLLKSIDKGATWSEIPSPSPLDAGTRTLANLAWHAMTISVDPRDANTLWMGGLDVWRTQNSGANWQKMSYWAPVTVETQQKFVHADVHRIEFRPENPSELLVSTDGGLFYTAQTNGESPVFEGRNRSYSTLQYYYGAIHPEAGRNLYLGGLQDNGSYLDTEFDGQPISGNVSGGDGFYCFVDEDEPELLISTVYYTWVYLFSFPNLQNARNVAAVDYKNGTFCNPMDYDWKYNFLYANGCGFAGQNANTLRVIRVSDEGLLPIPSNPLLKLPTNSPVPYSAIKWFINSGEFASTIYIGTEAGRLYKLSEAMVAGELTDMTSDQLPVAYISSIDIGQTEDTLLLTYSNYGVPSVFVTTDGGQNWKNVEANLPDMPVRWGIFNPKNPMQVMLATEIGVWTTENIFARNVIWTPDVKGMANVRVDMLKFRNSDNTVLAATHGRGMFTAKWEPSFTNSVPEESVAAKEDLVFPNPSDGRFQVKFENPDEATLLILDVAGKVVLNEKITNTQGTWQKSYDLSKQPKGTYLVKITSQGKWYQSRLILQ
jgi:photosystem II stability/assembly factor-like uncharacterized protein